MYLLPHKIFDFNGHLSTNTLLIMVYYNNGLTIAPIKFVLLKTI